MLSQDVTNKVRQQRVPRKEGVDTSRIREFLRMKPSSFTVSITTEDMVHIVKDLKKVFNVINVVVIEGLNYLDINSRMWLGLCSITGRRVEVRMHPFLVGLVLERLS